MKYPAGFCDVGGCVSEGEMVLCDDYGVEVFGGRVVQDCFGFLLCEATYVDGVTVERFGVLGSGCFFV